MGARRRYCACSRADVMHRRWRDICPLHGSTPEAKAYQDGLADGALATTPSPAAPDAPRTDQKEAE